MGTQQFQVRTVTASRKKEIFINGCFMANVVELGQTANVDEREHDIYGVDEQLPIRDDRSTDVTLTALSPDSREQWQKAIVGLNPASSLPAFVDPADKIDCFLWINERMADNSEYGGARWFGTFRPSPVPEPQGDAASDIQDQFGGRAEVAKDLPGCYIASELVALSASGSHWTGTLSASFMTPSDTTVALKWTQSHLGIQLVVADATADPGTVGNQPTVKVMPFRDAAVSGTNVVILNTDVAAAGYASGTTLDYAFIVGPQPASGEGVWPSTSTMTINSLWG